MPRRKNTKSETTDELFEEVTTAKNIVDEEINNLFSDNQKPGNV